MRSKLLLLGFAATSVIFAIATDPAQAQASRTWVSGVGDDANPCSRTAPCKTFAGAISKTARNGEINCLDPGGFGAVTITKSITIDCHEVFASILNAGSNARAIISRSVFSGNSTAGIAVGTSFSAVEVNISNSVISSNANGVLNVGGTTTIRLGNNDISFNTTALSGATQSFNNNRIQGNGSLGTAPTVINQQ